jgi:adenylate cyclase
MSDVFISYARSTESQARRIAGALRALGYGVWQDDELPAHRSYAEVIEEQLNSAKAVVVVWSAEAAKSEWVQSEADRARVDRKLVQLTVDGAPLPMPFDRIQCADLAGWNGEAAAIGWKKVAASIAALVGTAAPAPAARRAKVPAAGGAVSICVLPFANMSGEPEQAYFSDGISEDIITDLSKVSALAVVSRNTAFTFKGRSVGVAEVAGQLGVTHVLEGSVRKAGNRVRISAQLIEGASDRHVWAERYDRDLDDIFALQDEISQAIVAALKLKLLPEEKKAIERRGTTNAEAYDLYLMARQYREAGNSVARDHDTIVRLCERALKIDPNYARAWALMGLSQLALVTTYGRAGDNGAAACERALEIDPELAEPHAHRARQLYHAGRREAAIGELEIALRLDPESFDVNTRAGNLYYRERRFAEAARLLEKAAAESETDFANASMLISARIALGDAEGARRAARMTLERAERVISHDRGNGRAAAAGVSALATLGQRQQAREWIDRTLLLDPDNLTMRYNFACALCRQRWDAEAAIDLLGPVFEADPAGSLARGARADPDFDPIREDPRFQAMIAATEARLRKTSDTAD